MVPALLILFFLVGFFIHLFLCRKFGTDSQLIKTIFLYLALIFTLIRFFPQESNARFNLLLIVGWTIILIDNAHHRIPNFITGYCSLLICGIAVIEGRIVDSIAGGVEFSLIFCILAIASKLKIGIGDVKLAGVIGLIIGVVEFQELIFFVLVSAILGLCTLLIGPAKMRLKARIPFAAPMVAATVLIWPIWPMLRMNG
jgi:leader peptidase (prepilin peptidase)/N-methyltransferase